METKLLVRVDNLKGLCNNNYIEGRKGGESYAQFTRIKNQTDSRFTGIKISISRIVTNMTNIDLIYFTLYILDCQHLHFACITCSAIVVPMN